MNAVKLVALHAEPEVAERTWSAVAGDMLLGVWGADAPDRPVTVVREADRLVLSGMKRFARGLVWSGRPC